MGIHSEELFQFSNSNPELDSSVDDSELLGPDNDEGHYRTKDMQSAVTQTKKWFLNGITAVVLRTYGRTFYPVG